MDQVSALRIGSERMSLVPGPSEHASLGPAPFDARSLSETPGLRTVTFLTTSAQQLDPQRVSSEHPSLVDQLFYGSRTYRTRDVQTLSDGIDLMYKA
jgi:hypothetical protein